MREERIELSWYCYRWILSPVRLPVPPLSRIKCRRESPPETGFQNGSVLGQCPRRRTLMVLLPLDFESSASALVSNLFSRGTNKGCPNFRFASIDRYWDCQFRHPCMTQNKKNGPEGSWRPPLRYGSATRTCKPDARQFCLQVLPSTLFYHTKKMDRKGVEPLTSTMPL